MKLKRNDAVLAAGGYIKIGNRIIPTNTADYGYQSYDEISRDAQARYDAEQKAAAESAKRDKLQTAAQPKLSEVHELIDGGQAPIEAYFDVFVPRSGKADTVGGEIVRAMMQLLYRDRNDGDRFYESYGLETCASAAQYLMDNTSDDVEDALYTVAYTVAYDTIDTDADDVYTDGLQHVCELVIQFLEDHSEVFAEENTSNMRAWPHDKIDAIEPTYNTECEYPPELIAHIEAGHITTDDILYELESWDYLRDSEIDASDYGVYIEGLVKDDYLEVDEYLYRWLEQWAADLDEEYPFDEDEDEYE